MPRPIIDGDRRTYFPAPDAYVRLLRKVPGFRFLGADWPDAKTPRTDRPVRFVPGTDPTVYRTVVKSLTYRRPE